jgi:hypothetical protein
VYFLLSLGTAPVKDKRRYFGTLTMRSDYNDQRFYQIIIVPKDEYFEPRGRNIRDHEILLKNFPALSQANRNCERWEGPFKNREIAHPVFSTHRKQVNEQLAHGDALFEAYLENQSEFPDSFSNLDIIHKANDLLKFET